MDLKNHFRAHNCTPRAHTLHHIQSSHINYRQTQLFYYNLLLQGYMFRLLRVIIRPSNEPTQDYLILSALWDLVALTMGGVIVV